MTWHLTCEDMTNTMIGIQCDQCLAYFPFITGAVRHQESIWDNGGKCPDAKPQETKEQ